MRVYLARIRERHDGTLYVERRQASTEEESYVAISHVWGDPDTIQTYDVEGIGPVKLSPGKKDILNILKRPDICGHGWFWLDLFCIDQRPESPISISSQLTAIPVIYKSSRVVIVLIETPVCQQWADNAEKAAHEGLVDNEVFKVEETGHARKCPNLSLMDPWFDRLWTRQEGLYAMELKMIFLNKTVCARLTTAMSHLERYKMERKAIAKREAVISFVIDKLAYHGISSDEADISMHAYLDLLYKRQFNVSQHGGKVGPVNQYMPIMEAWRSGRTTAKPRDYVLAVFPDIEGYRTPQNPRKLSFSQLLADACGQFGGDMSNGFNLLPKIPKSLMTTVSSDSQQPWALGNPTNVTEALDPILMMTNAFLVEKQTALGGYVSDVDGSHSSNNNVQIRPINIRNKEELEELVTICDRNTNLVRHVTLSPPSGPLLGSDRQLNDERNILHRFFAIQFAEAAINQYRSDPIYSNEAGIVAPINGLVRHGNVNTDKLQLEGEIFQQEVKIFLICLICGTTISCATDISTHLELVIFTVEEMSGIKEIPGLAWEASGSTERHHGGFTYRTSWSQLTQSSAVCAWCNLLAQEIPEIHSFITGNSSPSPQQIFKIKTRFKPSNEESSSKNPADRNILVIEIDDAYVQLYEVHADPTRPKVYITNNSLGVYAALSYVWGENQPHRTQTSNIEAYNKEGIDLDQIPQTIKDAIQTTQRLGFRYLWVDSFCIIQDSKEDKNREIPLIRKTFQNAAVTIIAASSRKVSDGFLQDRPVPAPAIQVPFLCPNGHIGRMWIRSATHNPSEPVETRAWCYEERLLSPRALVFASNTVRYECQTNSENIGHSNSALFSFSDRLPGGLTQFDQPAAAFTTNALQLNDAWNSIVAEYTKRDLTHPRDKLIAFYGIAETFQTAWKNSKYLAGLWSHKLLEELLWTKNSAPQHPRPEKVRAPSWSWAAVDGPIIPGYSLQIFNEDHLECEILECDVTLKDNALPFGEVTGGLLRLSAAVNEVMWNSPRNKIFIPPTEFAAEESHQAGFQGEPLGICEADFFQLNGNSQGFRLAGYSRYNDIMQHANSTDSKKKPCMRLDASTGDEQN
ncbi:heterokaryon incompatibility protein domain-containing protein [Trichoderma velutinum]